MASYQHHPEQNAEIMVAYLYFRSDPPLNVCYTIFFKWAIWSKFLTHVTGSLYSPDYMGFFML